MIKIAIKSLWRGQVAVHRKYVKQAILAGQGLIFTLQGQQMVIAPQDVRGAIRFVSQELFIDRFTHEEYRLVYFDWNPNVIQGVLL